jgi:recombination protein RecA
VVYGNRTKVKVVKNKVAAPFTLAEFDILYAEGISWTGSIIDAGVEYGLIDKRGSWLSCDGKQLGQGREGARKALLEDPALASSLVEKVREAAQAKKL